jgi:arylsulfatase A-like enzyme
MDDPESGLSPVAHSSRTGKTKAKAKAKQQKSVINMLSITKHAGSINLKSAFNTAVLCSIPCLTACASPSAEKEKPNVLFIAVDDLNDWTEIFGGYPGVKTPNLARLANRGQVFTRAYCSAPASNPSRASLLTGIRPSSSGVYHNDQPWRPALPDAVTLPQYFTANGYEVEGTGKIFHNSYNDPASWPLYHAVEPSPVPPGSPFLKKAHFDWAPVQVSDEEMGDYKNISYAVDFLDKKDHGAFFLAVGFTRPHLPWYVPQKYFDLYPLDKIKRPDVIENDLEDIPEAGVRIAKPEGDHRFVVENNQWEKAIQGYLASITFFDAQLGRVLDALDTSAYKDNTIIVLFGDHGWHLGEKEHWRKFALWEEATRVPLIIVAPGITGTDTQSERTVNLIDIYPTLVELCRLPAKKELEGTSIVPLLKHPQAKWEQPSLTTHGLGNHSLRSERWRYTRYADGSEELYDHDKDPNEWLNLAKNEAFTDVKKDLSKWLPKTDAPDAKSQKESNPNNGKDGKRVDKNKINKS